MQPLTRHHMCFEEAMERIERYADRAYCIGHRRHAIGASSSASRLAAGSEAGADRTLEHDHRQQLGPAHASGIVWNGASVWLIFSQS